MNRTLIGVGLTFALVAFLGVTLVWYLALGLDMEGNSTISDANLSGPGSISITSGFEIEAVDEADAYYLLGYAHGREHPWTLNLLRQTAVGRLAEWFGDGVLPIDRLTRSLAIASGAQAAVNALPDEDRRILRSYARGVSDAFRTQTVVMDEHLVLFGVDPEPWKAWHSIALERMFAWLSEPPQRPERGDTAFAALHGFQLADESLREWLHLHGFDHSSAWAFDDSSGTSVETQLVYGATSLPLFVPAGLSWPTVRVLGVSLLGTPFFPLSSGPGGVNVTLLSSPRLIQSRYAAGYPDSVAADERYERIVLTSGEEELLTVPFLDEHVFFEPRSFASDSITAPFQGSLDWVGTRSLSDWPAWRGRMLQSAGTGTEAADSFRLIEGNGLFASPTGEKLIRGRPAVVERGGAGSVIVANHRLGQFAARRFLERAATPAVETLDTDVTSTWAETNLRAALRVLRPDSSFSPEVREAIDFLRNWDSRYDLASIGAPIFDAWMGAFSGPDDPYPIIAVPVDSLGRARMISTLEDALVSTVDSLASVAGPDPAHWRLEAFRKSERFFPVWSYSPLAGVLPHVNPRRFAPLSIQQPGHPTTMEWESGLFDYPRNSPSHVAARVRMAEPGEFFFKPDYQIGSGIIARHVVSAPEEKRFPVASVKERKRLTFLPGR